VTTLAFGTQQTSATSVFFRPWYIHQ